MKKVLFILSFLQSFICVAQLDDYRAAITYPNLAALDSGVHYVILDPETQLTKALWGTPGYPGICATPHPSCNIDVSRKWVANKTWAQWVLNEIVAKPTLQYILMKPGDYTPLGLLWKESNFHPTGYVQFMYYNPAQVDPWHPMYRDSLDFNLNVVMSSFWIWECNRVLFNGIKFWGNYETHDASEGNSLSIFDQGSDSCIVNNCVLTDAITYGFMIRKNEFSFIQNSLIHTQKNPCSDAPGIMVITSEFVPCRRSRILHNEIYDFCDAVQFGAYPAGLPEGGGGGDGVDINGLVMDGNLCYQSEAFYYTGGNGQRFQRGENGLDIKISASPTSVGNPDSTVWILRNRFRHYHNPLTAACLSGETNSYHAVVIANAYNTRYYYNIHEDLGTGVALAYTFSDFKAHGNVFNDIRRRSTDSTHDEQQMGSAWLLHVWANDVEISGDIITNADRNYSFYNESWLLDTTVIDLHDATYEGPLFHFYNNTPTPSATESIYAGRNNLFMPQKFHLRVRQ